MQPMSEYEEEGQGERKKSQDGGVGRKLSQRSTIQVRGIRITTFLMGNVFSGRSRYQYIIRLLQELAKCK